MTHTSAPSGTATPTAESDYKRDIFVSLLPIQSRNGTIQSRIKVLVKNIVERQMWELIF